MAQTTSIPFHIPYDSGEEMVHLRSLINENGYAYPAVSHQHCLQILESVQQSKSVLLTNSCTSALEIAALLLGIKPGDEVIMPSFAYPSMANAFALRQARIVFVDIDPITMNICPECIEQAISSKTRAILVMHYGGVACDMEKILLVAEKHNITIIEDAAHCIGATYNGRSLGTFGDMGSLSFHFTKNIHCVQGGALLVENGDLLEKALHIAEKGTDKARMRAGHQSHYSWTSLGSSYLMSSLSAAFLAAQLQRVNNVNQIRLKRWEYYQECFEKHNLREYFQLTDLPQEKEHNAHLFFIKCKDLEERTELIHFLLSYNIYAYFHYLPLHSSTAGKKYGVFKGRDTYTTRESERLLRLPLYPSLSLSDIERITESIAQFYKTH